MTTREAKTSLDSTFETAVRSMAVLESVMLRESYQACIKEGGDPLACCLKQDTRDGMLMIAPPPDFPDETGAHQALTMMRASIEDLIKALREQQDVSPPWVMTPFEQAVDAVLKSKAVLDMWKRIQEMDECQRGEGDPFYCWEEYGIWIFPFPRPLHPDWLRGITVSQALGQVQSAAVALLEAIDLEMEAWGLGKS